MLSKGKVPEVFVAMKNVKNYLDIGAEVTWETMNKNKAVRPSGTSTPGPLCRGNLQWRTQAPQHSRHHPILTKVKTTKRPKCPWTMNG